MQQIENKFTLFAKAFEGRPLSEFSSESAIKYRQQVARGSYTALFTLIMTLIIYGISQAPIPFLYSAIGDIANEDVISPLTSDIEPPERDSQQKESLSQRVPPIFDYDEKIIATWLGKWRYTFKAIRKEFYFDSKRNMKNPIVLDLLAKKVTQYSGQTLRPRDLLYLHENRFNSQTEETFFKLTDFLKTRLISNVDVFFSYYATGITIRKYNQGLSENLITDVSRVWSLDQAREVLSRYPSIIKEKKLFNARAAVEIIDYLIPPNLILNQSETDKRIEQISKASKQPVIHITKGQVLIHKGEKLTDSHLQLIQSVKELTSPGSHLKRFSLSFTVLFIFLFILFSLHLGYKKFWDLSLKDAFIFLVISTSLIILMKYGSPWLQFIFSSYGFLQLTDFILPVSTGAIMLHLMMGRTASYAFTLLVTAVGALVLEQGFSFTIFTFVICAAAIHAVGECRSRADLFKCGSWSGFLSAIIILALGIIQYLGFKETLWVSVFASAFFAFLSGILATVLASFMIPFFESFFGYTTSLKLLELANFHHPLLHSLMMKAPGTYHHSVIVGSLAEIAADSIHANGLLARVSAYYHDIGKMNKPLYFIENQSPGNNPHDHLQPSMSAKILFSHVKNGVRMGRDYRLGNKVIDIIEQHHGTTLTSFFFNKAKETVDASVESVDECHFRYPGPKPQTREAGIVMLADACEAATRSISDPTPIKIQTMVHHIITKRFLEEQFSDCDLTFRDLQVIELHFTKTLVSLHHHRIEYPGQNKALDKKNETVNNTLSSIPNKASTLKQGEIK